MDKLTVNGKRYIALGDLDNLCRVLKQEQGQRLYDENGEKIRELNDEEKAFGKGLNAVMTRIMEDELNECENRDDAVKLWKGIRDEWLKDRWCIAFRDDDGAPLFFRRFCYNVTPEGVPVEDGDELDEGTPTFTTANWQMKTFTDYHDAVTLRDIVAERSKIDELRVDRAFFYFAEGTAKERLLKAIFGEDYKEGDTDNDRND